MNKPLKVLNTFLEHKNIEGSMEEEFDRQQKLIVDAFGLEGHSEGDWLKPKPYIIANEKSFEKLKRLDKYIEYDLPRQNKLCGLLIGNEFFPILIMPKEEGDTDEAVRIVGDKRLFNE